MKPLRVFALFALASLALPEMFAQQGPVTQGSETVAKPKRKPDSSETDAAAPANPDNGKIPSKFDKKNLPQGVPVFHTDALTVSVDVAVLDNKGHFIPKIPKGNFRILEDNVPQQVAGYSVGEAPMTITMVVEFSNRSSSSIPRPGSRRCKPRTDSCRR